VTNQSRIPASFKTVRGVSVPDQVNVSEGYSLTTKADSHSVLLVNVSADRIADTFRRLASCVPEPGFLVLETPTHRDVEATLRKSQLDPFHVDVHYRDGLQWSTANQVFSRFEDLLVNDGEVSFGFGSHQGLEEVFVGPYKLFRLFSMDPSRFTATLSDLGFRRVERLRTVLDSFTRETPGRRSVLRDVSLSIYDMLELLKKEDFYFHGHRSD
jgi:hypothetical protein